MCNLISICILNFLSIKETYVRLGFFYLKGAILLPSLFFFWGGGGVLGVCCFEVFTQVRDGHSAIEVRGLHFAGAFLVTGQGL